MHPIHEAFGANASCINVQRLTITLLPEHVGCSKFERIALPSPHLAHVLASPVPGEVRRALKCEFMWVDEQLLGRDSEAEIKVDDTLLVEALDQVMRVITMFVEEKQMTGGCF